MALSADFWLASWSGYGDHLALSRVMTLDDLNGYSYQRGSNTRSEPHDPLRRQRTGAEYRPGRSPFDMLGSMDLNAFSPMRQDEWVYIFRRLGGGPVELYAECRTLFAVDGLQPRHTMLLARDGAARPIPERRSREPLAIRDTMRLELTNPAGTEPFHYAFVGSFVPFSTNAIDYFCGRAPFGGVHKANHLLNRAGRAGELFEIFRVDLTRVQPATEWRTTSHRNPCLVSSREGVCLPVLHPFEVLLHRRGLVDTLLLCHKNYVEPNAVRLFMGNAFIALTGVAAILIMRRVSRSEAVGARWRPHPRIDC